MRNALNSGRRRVRRFRFVNFSLVFGKIGIKKLMSASGVQDTEIIRHATENGAHGPAMDFLAWMYQEGRGLDKDFRKAYMWYERAKLAGVENLRGSSSKIYDRMSERDKYFADLQLAEDNKKSKGKAGDYKRIQMQVLGKDRDKEYTIKK